MGGGGPLIGDFAVFPAASTILMYSRYYHPFAKLHLINEVHDHSEVEKIDLTRT